MGTDLSQDSVPSNEKNYATLELEEKSDLIGHKKTLFSFLLFGIFFLYLFAGLVVCLSLLNGNTVPATNTVIVVTLIMVPTILTLAFMRFLYGNSSQVEEKNIPSLTLNAGKELVSLVKEIAKKD